VRDAIAHGACTDDSYTPNVHKSASYFRAWENLRVYTNASVIAPRAQRSAGDVRGEGTP
jgi:hypothetical protein